MALSNLDAERALLGACMISADPDVVLELAEQVQPGDFYANANGQLWTVLCEVAQAGNVVDILVINDALAAKGINLAGPVDSDKVDPKTINMAELSSLINIVPSAVHAPAYAAIVHRLAWLRRFVDMAALGVKKAHAPTNPDELYAWAIDALGALTPRSAADGHLLMGDAVARFYAAVLDQRQGEKAKGTQLVLDWPWASWNSRRGVRPMQPGDLGLFIAADGSGKTTYLNQIGEHWAKQGAHVVIAHLENSHADLLDRRTCRYAGVRLADLEDGNIDARQRAEIADMQTHIDLTWGTRLHYSHCPGWTMRQIINDAEALARDGKCDALIIDYFDKVLPDADLTKSFRDDLRREAAMMERLKIFAEQRQVRVLTASQMTKAGKVAGGRATRSDMRGTGEKSDKCQLVLILNREISEAGEQGAGGEVLTRPGGYSTRATITVNKQNRGETGMFEQRFDGPRHRVLDPQDNRRA